MLLLSITYIFSKKCLIFFVDFRYFWWTFSFKQILLYLSDFEFDFNNDSLKGNHIRLIFTNEIPSSEHGGIFRVRIANPVHFAKVFRNRNWSASSDFTGVVLGCLSWISHMKNPFFSLLALAFLFLFFFWHLYLIYEQIYLLFHKDLFVCNRVIFIQSSRHLNSAFQDN